MRVSTNGRSLPNSLISKLSDKIKLGINMLLNRDTITCLESEVTRYAKLGVQEILLLPQMPTKAVDGVDNYFVSNLDQIVRDRQWPARLTISAAVADDFTCAVRIPGDQGLRQCAHIAANGIVKNDSMSEHGVKIDSRGVLFALKELEALS